jgi:hypothetical protein
MDSDKAQEKYQLLCANCNKAVSYERGIFGSRWLPQEPR